MDWRPLKGSLVFTILKSGWFELTFSNAEDFNRIWFNRPYHVFSQLLLLKTWYPGFDPTCESISQLDLRVRLHYLPEEFTNSDALDTIIEGNLIGKFLKMDPTHNSERWNLFTRFCINTDVEKTLGRSVIVPDEHLNQIRFTLWFDDFSPGCGACGKSGHVFKDCPSKNAPIPTLQLTFKKPSSKSADHGDNDMDSSNAHDWNLVGKDNKILKAEQNYLTPSNNVYLLDKGGIKIIYESEDSEEGIQCFLEENEQFEITLNLIVVAADLYPYNLVMENKKLDEYGIYHGERIYHANELAGKVGLQQLETSGVCKDTELSIKLKDYKRKITWQIITR